jgi:hypothetical protein
VCVCQEFCDTEKKENGWNSGLACRIGCMQAEDRLYDDT